MRIVAPKKTVGQLTRLELALTLFQEHKTLHQRKVREAVIYTFLFFGLAVVSALTHHPGLTILALVTMLWNGVDGIREHKAAQECEHRFKDGVQEIAYDEFGGPVRIDWETLTADPQNVP